MLCAELWNSLPQEAMETTHWGGFKRGIWPIHGSEAPAPGARNFKQAEAPFRQHQAGVIAAFTLVPLGLSERRPEFHGRRKVDRFAKGFWVLKPSVWRL